jgi:hypothetical protein
MTDRGVYEEDFHDEDLAEDEMERLGAEKPSSIDLPYLIPIGGVNFSGIAYIRDNQDDTRIVGV